MGKSDSPVGSLQVVSSPGVGGREIYAPVLARKLNAQGHPAWVLARPDSLAARLAGEWSVPVVARRPRPYFDPVFILGMARWLRSHPVHVIHVHWSRDLSNLILANALAGGRRPVILTKHVYATEPKRDPFHAWVFRHTDRVLGVSRLVAENVLKTVPVDPAKVGVLYNGIDVEDVWNPALAAAGVDLKSEWKIPAASPVLGYAGRLNAGKGVHLVLQAFDQLAGEFPDWHLVLIGRAVGAGEQAYAERWRTWAEAKPWGRRVHWLGFLDNMPAVMKQLDLFACASALESLGMVLVEAMAMERPVVGPDTGGVPEIISAGRGGRLFHHPDAGHLAATLKPLLADAGLRQQLGREARQVVREKFNLDRSAQNLVELYRDCLARRKTR
ncbi:MAG: glycosyltransferase family 4 protein [candidate division FCPU426 bacterium]